MLLYSDSYIQKMEFECKWIDCFRYLYHEWTEDKNNIALFLKFSVNTWYILTLDGPELTLNKKQFDMLTCALSECLSYFEKVFSQQDNAQWLFGYMMEVRTDLFLNSGLEYTEIAQIGSKLIKKASDNGNIFAELLFAFDNYSARKIKKIQNTVKNCISYYFDAKQKVDQYFIEIFLEARN